MLNATNVLFDPGFEESSGSHGWSATSVQQVWQIDPHSFLEAERGVTPRSGTQMMRFDAAGPTDCCLDETDAEIGQLVNVALPLLYDKVRLGIVQVDFGASFNRVSGDEMTDSQFLVEVTAYDRLTYDRPHLSPRQLGGSQDSILSDSDTLTWESIQTSYVLHPATISVLVTVSAVENVSNDTVIGEFDGHYIDDAWMTIQAKPRAWQNDDLPEDINADGHVTALDALLVINELGRRAYSVGPSGELHDAVRDIDEFPAVYYDQNGDEKVTAIDALAAINAIGDQLPVRTLLTWSFDSGELVGPSGPTPITGTVTFDADAVSIGGISSPSTENGGIVAWTIYHPRWHAFDSVTTPVPFTFTDLPIQADGRPGNTAFGVSLAIPDAPLNYSGSSSYLMGIGGTDVNGRIGGWLAGAFSANHAFAFMFTFVSLG